MSTIRMPQLGESVVEGTIGKWLVSEGQQVEKDQPVVEILTDKADSEINAPEAGVVTKLLAQEGETVTVGAGLCELDSSAKPTAAAKSAKSNGGDKKSVAPAAAPAQAAAPAPASASTSAKAPTAPPPPAAASTAATASLSGDGAQVPRSSPSVRKLAREQGVDLVAAADGGRATKDDVLRIAGGETTTAKPAAPRPAGGEGSYVSGGAFKMPPYIARPGDEIVPMSRRRRIIADHMVFSKLTSPHVVTVAEADVHKTELARKANKDALKKEGVNLTFLAFVASATARALRENRRLNARVLDDSFVLLSEINLGIAVDTPEGLVVPVIRNAADLTVRGLAKAIEELATKARDGKLTPDDLAGKTFTITNPGRKGNLHGGAIISQPNVGILRTGEIKKRVVVVERDDEDLMAIHPVMYMALSYDHRIVDGVAANSFLFRIREILEAGDFSI